MSPCTDAVYPRCPRLCASFCHVITVFTIVFTILTSSTIAQSDLTFTNTPSHVAQCTPFTISWSGGLPPFNLAIVGPWVNTPLQLYTELGSSSFNWSTDVPAGTTVSFQLSDAGGEMVRSQAALTVEPGPASCLPSSTSQTSLSSHSASQSLSSVFSSTLTTASPTASISGSLIQASDLGPGPYSGIAIGGAFAIAGAVLLLVMLRRKCRRQGVSRGPEVDLNESPRMTGATTPPGRGASLRLRPPTTIYMPPSRKLSQLFEQHSPTSPDSIPLHELVGQQHTPSFTDPPSRASRPGPSGRMSKRSFLERRGAVRSDPILRPLPMPPGLGDDPAPARPTSLPLEYYADSSARGPRQELDGGVRLAGGPPEDEWDRLSDLLPTIPPPYRRYTK
ncbi:hypothetical protein L226DRAFT_570016 [Lentinus tigrinus ALCF2SS1-7]|uniref:Uncharacterized protein n=1 Tax=Lentinus tigrinus ALCF2SS1-6 TaxID=1328759 RepID=A0A5C2S9L7_9APHY|nr:hypothetical protein L227DRAFT_88845 [Lentinus tigrinus ALCF2SS1-6]RPD75765.1 hypothetical protein L226DRAFT_570016 [Lentinus tigrinus ALCF2SS1-7]